MILAVSGWRLALGGRGRSWREADTLYRVGSVWGPPQGGIPRMIFKMCTIRFSLCTMYDSPSRLPSCNFYLKISNQNACTSVSILWGSWEATGKTTGGIRFWVPVRDPSDTGSKVRWVDTTSPNKERLNKCGQQETVMGQERFLQQSHFTISQKKHLASPLCHPKSSPLGVPNEYSSLSSLFLNALQGFLRTTLALMMACCFFWMAGGRWGGISAIIRNFYLIIFYIHTRHVSCFPGQ